MRDILPQQVVDAIRDRMIAGVTLAENHYNYSAADEDSLTGALGESLLAPRLLFHHGEDVFAWSTEYFKIRGRGKGAAEKTTGADGVFQITVRNVDGKVLRTKCLPFQSKKNWRGKNALLAQQSSLLVGQCGAGIAIDYTNHGYFAASAAEVVLANGSRTEISADGKLSRLALLLGIKFLECEIGRIGMHFDPALGRFVGGDRPDTPSHVIATSVQRLTERPVEGV
jgi:hypothetical protein